VSAQNHRATVEYDGTDYYGFQLQPNRATIQGELERALERVTQQVVRVNGAGRTDAGVHARGQVISFQVSWRHPLGDLHRALNAVLPADVAVRDLALADERFHARFSARRRTYVYTVYNNTVRSPLLARFAHHVPSPLHVEAMTEAATALLGCQDMAAFGQPPTGAQTVRCVYRAGWRPGSQAGLIEFEIQANAFLRGMVRRIVGSLLQVGSGMLTRDGFVDLLASRDLARCGVRAPACGLCLERVSYQDST
jgi:tRNA pseudouridine38-40 synthase